MRFRAISLKNKIFLLVNLFLLMAFLLVFLITRNQHEKRVKTYSASRFQRKTKAILSATKYRLHKMKMTDSGGFNNQNLQQWIREMSDIHQVDVAFYDAKGSYLVGSVSPELVSIRKIPPNILKNLYEKEESKYEEDIESETLLDVYRFVEDENAKKVGIVNIYYLQDNSQQKQEFNSFMKRLFFVFFLLFLLGVLFAYYLSGYIARPLRLFLQKIRQIKIENENERIQMSWVPAEIVSLKNAYNFMLDKLEQGSKQLAEQERTTAALQMARQMAHEIKNPLTPMRLYIQNFGMNWAAGAQITKNKAREFTQVLLQQIDTINATLNKFSNYLDIGKKNDTLIDLIASIKNIIQIFQDKNIEFQSDLEEFFLKMDKELLHRVFTNLIKNAVEATQNIQNSEIKIIAKQKQENLFFEISDNGTGIPESIQSKIFDLNFTNKSTGSGFGLFIVKKIVESYKGEISFESKQGAGTKFFIKLPKN